MGIRYVSVLSVVKNQSAEDWGWGSGIYQRNTWLKINLPWTGDGYPVFICVIRG